MTIDRHNILVGLIFIVFGAGFVFFACRTLPIGSPSDMGPGFFPVAIGVVLMALGGMISLTAAEANETASGPLPLRGIALISASVIISGLLINRAGFVPTVAVATFVSCLASRRTSLKSGLSISLGLTILCYLIFKLGLNLSIPTFGTWLVG